jgi:hypothetical protein
MLGSGASAWYARSQSQLAAGQLRANVQVLDANLVEPITDASFIKVQLKLKNLGQTTALNVQADMDDQPDVPDPKGEGAGNYATLGGFRDVKSSKPNHSKKLCKRACGF